MNELIQLQFFMTVADPDGVQWVCMSPPPLNPVFKYPMEIYFIFMEYLRQMR